MGCIVARSDINETTSTLIFDLARVLGCIKRLLLLPLYVNNNTSLKRIDANGIGTKKYI